MTDNSGQGEAHQYPVKRGARVALRLWWWRATGRGIRERVCGRCAYPIRGLDSSRCPECGADLSRDGVLHPGYRYEWGTLWHRWRPWAAQTGWLAANVLLLSVLIQLCFFHFCWPGQFLFSAEFESFGSLIRIEGEQKTPPMTTYPVAYERIILILISPQAGKNRAAIEIVTEDLRFRDGATPDGPWLELNESSLEQWFADHGVRFDRPRWPRESSPEKPGEQIAELIAFIRSARDGTLPRPQHHGYRWLGESSDGDLQTSFFSVQMTHFDVTYDYERAGHWANVLCLLFWFAGAALLLLRVRGRPWRDLTRPAQSQSSSP